MFRTDYSIFKGISDIFMFNKIKSNIFFRFPNFSLKMQKESNVLKWLKSDENHLEISTKLIKPYSFSVGNLYFMPIMYYPPV